LKHERWGSPLVQEKYQEEKACNKRHPYRIIVVVVVVKKGKAVPLQAWTGPEGSRKLRFPDFVTVAQDGGKVVSLTHRPLLPPGNSPATHFCLRLSRPRGRSAIGRILCQ